MKCPPVLDSELARLQALSEYGLREGPLPSLDSVVEIASRVFRMPLAAVNLVGADHVFFAASQGFEGQRVDMRRDVSFCAHAIARNEVMVVPDAAQDERFHDNPLVTGLSGVRFYAGAPLFSPDGMALGALCVIDTVPHYEFSDDDRARLCDLAQMACDRLELRRLEHSTERARKPFHENGLNSPTAVVWFDEGLRVMAWNKAAASMFGHLPADGPGRQVLHFIAARHRHQVADLVARAAAAGTSDGLAAPEGLHGVRKDGSEFPLGVALFCWRDHGHLTFHAHLQDGTHHPGQQSSELRRLASTDQLTGLANRASLYRRLEEVLGEGDGACLFLVDLDGFKDVNDTLGHEVGDGVLREVAYRLVECIPPHATAARAGGDEFAVLIPGCTSHADCLRFARSIVDSLAEPISVDGHEIHITGTCGLSTAPQDAQEALELFSNADLALFKAKSYGRGQVAAYVAELRSEASARRLYSIELHRAVTEGEFVLFYQPQINLRHGRLRGAEALLRWQHPQRGLLSPAAFLPALESGPLAAVVGFWVLDEACAQAALWRRSAPDFRIGVNLFGTQFRVPDMVGEVAAALERHGLPPQALELEITENIVLDDDDVVLQALNRLRAMGVGLAFDDFGTGYASLSLLKKYPLSRLKIDRSFVHNLPDSERDTAVVRAILDMARSFELETVAEGVETAGQRDFLTAHGCEEGQGYFFGRPVSAYEFAEAFALQVERRRVARA